VNRIEIRQNKIPEGQTIGLKHVSESGSVRHFERINGEC
jgi:hypothetical protein